MESQRHNDDTNTEMENPELSQPFYPVMGLGGSEIGKLLQSASAHTATFWDETSLTLFDDTSGDFVHHPHFGPCPADSNCWAPKTDPIRDNALDATDPSFFGDYGQATDRAFEPQSSQLNIGPGWNNDASIGTQLLGNNYLAYQADSRNVFNESRRGIASSLLFCGGNERFTGNTWSDSQLLDDGQNDLADQANSVVGWESLLNDRTPEYTSNFSYPVDLDNCIIHGPATGHVLGPSSTTHGLGMGSIDWQSGLTTPFPLMSDGIKGLGLPTTSTISGLAFNHSSSSEGYMPIPLQSVHAFPSSLEISNLDPAVPNSIPTTNQKSLLANSTLPNAAFDNVGHANAGLTFVAPMNLGPIPQTQPASHTPAAITCARCNKTFTRTSGLARHMSSVHDLARHNCPVAGCTRGHGRGFSCPDKVTEHLRKKHAALGYAKRA